ncbi:MAG: hypothetical protein IKI03_07900 [Clostridia bacterium]|nr:hypothetical protein [Clostridia bacterium]
MTAAFAAGASLVLACSLAVTVSVVSDKRKRIRHTEAVLDLISHVRSNIELFLTPVSGIFSDFRNDDLEACGFSAVLRDSGIEEAVRKGAASLSVETEEVLTFFSSSLGKSYKEDQLRLCDYCGEKIKAELEREREELKRNVGAYRFAPLIFALFIILCFI